MSAMVDQDMLFRSGLMLSVLVLAGIFGTSIARRIVVDDDRSIESISNDLAEIINAIHGSGPGSFSKIKFTNERMVYDPAISFPSKIGGRSYIIEILPGMVALEIGYRKEIVIVDDFIVPCYSPDDRLDFGRNLSRRSGEISGGFRLETPTSLVIKVPEGASDGEVFFYPASIDDDEVLFGYGELIDLIEEPISFEPGCVRMVNISTHWIHYMEGSLLLLSPSMDHTLSGSCPIPAYLPSQIEGEKMIPSDIHQITFYKKIIIGPEGYFEMRMGVTNDVDQILP